MPGCVDGMAGINLDAAWVRAITDTPTQVSRTGPLFGMELLHTFGEVPSDRSDPYSAYHSPAVYADITAPYRAYNLVTRSFLADNRTVMNISGPGWNNDTTLLERDDWSYTLCLLGGLATNICSSATPNTTPAGVVGAATGV